MTDDTTREDGEPMTAAGDEGYEGWDPAVDLRTDIPHPARMYDTYLGGKDNFPADREAARKVEEAVPGTFETARANRRFLARAVRYAATELGIRQFLDIGTGIPTSPNVHEVAQAVHPDARVAYVDNDPIVLAHARALLRGTSQGRTCYVDADVREPDAFLSHPDLHATLDLDRPVALQMVALVSFIPDEDCILDVVDRLRERLAPGSVFVLSCSTLDGLPPDSVARIERAVEAYAAGGTHLTLRSRPEVERFFGPLDLVDPGVVKVHAWRPDDPVDHAMTDADVSLYGGLAVVR